MIYRIIGFIISTICMASHTGIAADQPNISSCINEKRLEQLCQDVRTQRLGAWWKIEGKEKPHFVELRAMEPDTRAKLLSPHHLLECHHASVGKGDFCFNVETGLQVTQQHLKAGANREIASHMTAEEKQALLKQAEQLAKFEATSRDAIFAKCHSKCLDLGLGLMTGLEQCAIAQKDLCEALTPHDLGSSRLRFSTCSEMAGKKVTVDQTAMCKNVFRNSSCVEAMSKSDEVYCPGFSVWSEAYLTLKDVLLKIGSEAEVRKPASK